MEINQNILRDKMTNGDKMIVKFYTDWCSGCKIMKPIFNNVMNNNHSENISYHTINVEENVEIAKELGIKSIPVIKVFNGKEVIDTKVGVLTEDNLIKLKKTF